MIEWFVKKFDWWLYLKFHKSLDRQNVDKAYLYLLKLKLQGLECGMPQSLKDSVKKFHEALNNFATIKNF